MAQSRLSQLSLHVRPHVNAQPNGSIPKPSTPTTETPYKALSEQPLGSTHPIRIVTIGAGASGLNMARLLRLHVPKLEQVVYEKNPQVGGTWFENRYPGCKCDIPSHNYQFSWRPNPEWSSFFSPAEEIQRYLLQVYEEEGLQDVVKLGHQVVSAKWDEDGGIWSLRIKDIEHGREFDDTCNFLLDASGILNHWTWPAIPGLHDFDGHIIHSANWPKNFNFAGKTVAVIGNGSSGVQIVPALQPDVQRLVHFVRDPTWMAPPRLQVLAAGAAGNMLSEVELDENECFTPAQIARFKADPQFYRRFVKSVEQEVNGNYPLMIKDSAAAAAATAAIRSYMEDRLEGDERLCKALIPNFPLGCRRLTPDVGYLASLRAANVRVVTDSIVRVVPQGIETNKGEIIELDAIVCATGFNVSFCPRFPIIGREGNLQDVWTRNLPKAYMSCAVPDFPNFFTFLGPNAPIGHGSVFTITEHIAKYITRIILKCQRECIKSIAPTQDAVDDLSKHTQAFMPRTAWAGSCRSWFKNNEENGPVTALHPGSRIHFFHMLQNFRGEDWEYTYVDDARRNRFYYLGNGTSEMEFDGSDSTWYLDDPDKLD
ncbi:hypothetical protein QBC46DRAFT_358167 [Diplogelasinospora grovesii]|uniref:Uncharacterized protein n=1 Tax=Diplogelasinospora grovesii TaxID=303347 RepID=A0AAN6S0I8_9PEZI|nr:hypothetical protein QBC46DRAFT_358167 [Diplogelasinospora grovesii]